MNVAAMVETRRKLRLLERRVAAHLRAAGASWMRQDRRIDDLDDRLADLLARVEDLEVDHG